MLASHLTQDPLAVHIAEFNQCGKRGERGLNISRLLGDNHEMIILAIVGEGDAEAIKDLSARRGHKP